MNDSLSRLLQRRSVPPRWLGGPGPSEPEIETLLKVASRVPDHGKLVPWRFILIQGEARGRLGEVLATAFQTDNPGADAQSSSLPSGSASRMPLSWSPSCPVSCPM